MLTTLQSRMLLLCKRSQASVLLSMPQRKGLRVAAAARVAVGGGPDPRQRRDNRAFAAWPAVRALIAVDNDPRCWTLVTQQLVMIVGSLLAMRWRRCLAKPLCQPIRTP